MFILFISANDWNIVFSEIQNIKNLILDLSIFSVYGYGVWSIFQGLVHIHM